MEVEVARMIYAIPRHRAWHSLLDWDDVQQDAIEKAVTRLRREWPARQVPARARAHRAVNDVAVEHYRRHRRQTARQVAEDLEQATATLRSSAAEPSLRASQRETLRELALEMRTRPMHAAAFRLVSAERLRSDEAAATLSRAFGRPVTSANARQLAHRFVSRLPQDAQMLVCAPQRSSRDHFVSRDGAADGVR